MNPVELSARLKSQYLDYLKTMFYFKDRDLRESFGAELDKWDLAKGVYLQATPTFKLGGSLSEVYHSVCGGQLPSSIEEAMTAGRPLYSHQQKAIAKVLSGKNIVVSTGTGSGKTESFLLPILLDLYKEHLAGTLSSGVRALILYPMNALANDQRDRLVGVPSQPTERGGIAYELKRLKSDFALSAGQYIGETPEDSKDKSRIKGDTAAGVGELIYRSQMRLTPPNVLLTNFSMLEYLLLRPDDSPLFDGANAATWKYLVLDEAHQYRGAMGIEMAMLIRRLKQRLKEQGCENTLRCIATSASLVNGANDIPAVAKFASELFGEEFHPDDVILGEPSLEEFTRQISLEPNTYLRLSKLVDQAPAEAKESFIQDELKAVCSEVNLDVQGDSFDEMLGALLLADRRAAELKETLVREPMLYQELCSKLFPSMSAPEAGQATMALVELMLNSRDPATGNSMLAARFHLFLRSLEGAFITFSPKPRVIFERRLGCGAAPGFEIALCRECGQHYLVGKIVDGKLGEAKRDPADEDFGADFFRPRSEKDIGEESKGEVYRLCCECGTLVALSKSLTCGHDAEIFLERQADAIGREDQMSSCSQCGYTGRDPVRELVHGNDGPHAVIASTLYQNLPIERNKVLAFADGRQDAAFFAWYLEKRYSEILGSSLIIETLQENQSGSVEFSISDFVPLLASKIKSRSLLKRTATDTEYRKEAAITLYKELITDRRRNSPEGVGLIKWQIALPADFPTIPSLMNAPLNLSAGQSRELVLLLLDSLRVQHAVEIETFKGLGVEWSDFGVLGHNGKVSISPPPKSKDFVSWAGKTGIRVAFLNKCLAKLVGKRPEVEAEDILREIWDVIKDYDRGVDNQDRILVQGGDGYRINSRYYRLSLVGENEAVFVCDSCKSLGALLGLGCCRRHKCPGSLHETTRGQLDPNHYRQVYLQQTVGRMRVEEHTAQLDSVKAREFQHDFKLGKINVLSCSTTFELGVDLGDLDTIFLRNVPPESFNYDQRVGRSGRRRGRPGFAITFCKKGPHDLYHFSDPLGMLRGKVKPPILSIKNPKIVLRHLCAYALSEFFRHGDNAERFKNVATFLGDMENPTSSSDFADYLRMRSAEFCQLFRRLVKEDQTVIEKLHLDSDAWIDLMAGPASKLACAELEVSSDYSSVKAFEKRASIEGDYKQAEWGSVRAKTIAECNVLSFLSRKTVIPKYGFPVDVVELDTLYRTGGSSDAFSVGLDRDLSIAISEFAPGSQLIANKKLWTSYGIKRVRNKELETKDYFICPDHNVFQQWSTTEGCPSKFRCGCPGQRGRYVVPSFGFTTSKSPPTEPTGRVVKLYSNRPFFAQQIGMPPEEIPFPVEEPVVTVTRARPGVMVVLCEGRKRQAFRICNKCGCGSFQGKKLKDGHKDAYGKQCTGLLESLSLGHEFETDIVQLSFKHPVNVASKLHLAYSLASAIVEASAEALEVPSSDISVTVGPLTGAYLPAIIVYDNVPGGAGLVSKLEDPAVLVDILRMAKKRVNGGCSCHEDSSCYGCLRSYRNQFMHEHLSRGAVKNYLSGLLDVLDARKGDLVKA